jgi:radical SAM protein with 4Fe4S-binding SPASM domain
MSVNERWLGRGWYPPGASGDGHLIWSSDVAYFNARGCDRIHLGFLTRYPDFTSSPQRVTVRVNGEVQFSERLESGLHEVSISCDGAKSVRLEVEAFSPAKYSGSTDSRVLGIGLFNLTPTMKNELVETPVYPARNLVQKSLPLTMQIEISTACHLSCSMCSRTKKTGGSAEHMKPHIWRNFFQTARHSETVNILGTGEPWTHPLFLDYLLQLDEAGIAVEIVTAGDLVNLERAQVLGQMRHLREVSFSIDSPDPETYLRIRGQPLSRALAGLRRTQNAVGSRTVVRIAAAVMKDNMASLAGFPSLLREYSVRRLTLRGVNHTSTGTRAMVPEYTADERATLLKIRDEAEALGVKVDLLPTIPADLVQIRGLQFSDEINADREVDLFEEPVMDEVPQTRICFDPWEKAIVTRNGDVYPCECYHLQQPIGSIASKSFQHVWLSEEYQSFRRRLLSSENVGCRSCERRAWGTHPLNQFAAEIVSCALVPGGESEIKLLNVGALPWTGKCPVRLGTARSRDRQNSALEHHSWISPNRVATHMEPVVLPGEEGTFRFLMTEIPGTAPPERFQFVVEHVCWLPNTEIGWSSSEGDGPGINQTS